MKRQFLLFFMLFIIGGALNAQTIEELKAKKAEKNTIAKAKQAEINSINSEIATIQKQIDILKGWRIGGTGILGFDLNTNYNWFALATPNSQSTGYGVTFDGFAIRDAEKYFWRNLLNVSAKNTLAKTDKNLDESILAHASGIDISSLFGYKLSPKFAISAEGKWTSAFLSPKNDSPTDLEVVINNPGQLTLSAGLTWLPIKDLVVLIHPLGYQKNWPGEFFSSPGAKIGANYVGKIYKGIGWTSNLSAFVPYSSEESVDFNISDVSYTVPYDGIGDFVNWTWLNTFTTSLYKGLGVSFSIGLRNDKQIWDLGNLKGMEVPVVSGLKSNGIQAFTNLGLSYGF